MYKITQNTHGQTIIMKINGDSITSFIEDNENYDYQDYLKWLAEGNEPEPADE